MSVDLQKELAEAKAEVDRTRKVSRDNFVAGRSDTRAEEESSIAANERWRAARTAIESAKRPTASQVEPARLPGYTVSGPDAAGWSTATPVSPIVVTDEELEAGAAHGLDHQAVLAAKLRTEREAREGVSKKEKPMKQDTNTTNLSTYDLHVAEQLGVKPEAMAKAKEKMGDLARRDAEQIKKYEAEQNARANAKAFGSAVAAAVRLNAYDRHIAQELGIKEEDFLKGKRVIASLQAEAETNPVG